MLVRVTSMILRTVAALTLLLGLIRWFGVGGVIIPIHMLLGILVMLSLFVLAGATITTKGGTGPAIGAIILGLIMIFVGLNQQYWLIGSLHWLIQVLHLLIGLSAIGIGEAIAKRYKRLHQQQSAPETAQV